MNEFDDDDPLDGILSSESESAKPKPKPAPVKSEPVISKSLPEKSAAPSKSSKSVESKEINFSFSEDDSLLDLKPKKTEMAKKPETKPETKPATKPSKPETDPFENIGGLAGFSDEEVSELTFSKSEEVASKNKRAVSPKKEQADDSWLQNLLGKPEKEKAKENVPQVKKSFELSDDDDTLNIISKTPKKTSQPQIQNKGTVTKIS